MSKSTVITVTRYESPCGPLLLGSLGHRLCLCDWQVEKLHDKVMPRLKRLIGARLEDGITPVLNDAITELNEYFSGKRKEFTIPLELIGSDFQLRVWEELQKVPYGTTLSYRELATSIDKPTAVRAVANANGANAISILIPCHRIIGSDHTLTGYGGGLNIKEFLLNLESASY